jgi:dissimilatory sulfite reductase (desulfoviridin) alpha/beta subunit
MSAGFKLKNGALLLSTEAPGGIYNAEQLRQVAKISEDGALIVKVTEDQRLAVVVAKGDVEKVSKDLSHVGLGVRHYQEGLHQATSCIGKLCSEYQQDALKSAVDITAQTRDLKTSMPIKIAVNGCSKCCNPCHTMDISVVGDSSGYRISLGGKAQMIPEFGQFAAEAVPSEKLPQLLRSVITTYSKLANPDETLQELIERSGMGPFAKVLAPWSQDAGGSMESPAFGESSDNASGFEAPESDAVAFDESSNFDEQVEFDENSLQLDEAASEAALENIEVDEFGGLDLADDLQNSPDIEIAEQSSNAKTAQSTNSAIGSELDDISLDASIGELDELDEVQLNPESVRDTSKISGVNLTELDEIDLTDGLDSSSEEEKVDFNDLGDLDANDLGLVAENELDLNDGILDKVDSEQELESKHQVQSAASALATEESGLDADLETEELGSLDVDDLTLDDVELADSSNDAIGSTDDLELGETFEASSVDPQVETTAIGQSDNEADPELSDDISNLDAVMGTDGDADVLEKMVDEEMGAQRHLAEIADDSNELERLETLSLLDDDIDDSSEFTESDAVSAEEETQMEDSIKQTSSDKRNIASIKKINPETKQFSISDIEFTGNGNLSLVFSNGLTLELGSEVFEGGNKALKIAGYTLNILNVGGRKQIEFNGIKLSIPELAA